MTFEFTLKLETSLSMENISDQVFECGCDDALLSSENGLLTLDFDREAPDLDTAISSAIDQLKSINIVATAI